MLMRLAISLAALTLLAASPLHAQRHRGMTDTTDWLDECRDGGHRWNDDDRARGCEVRRSAIAAPKGHVSIDAGENGGIRVIGGDADSMVVVAMISTSAGSDADAAAIARQVQIEVTPTSVRATGPAIEGRRRWYVSFDVILPRGADVSATTHNGGVYLQGLNGKVEARAVNGPLSVYEMAGDVSGRTQNGPINAELRGTQWQGTGLDLQTQNGPVVLNIASGYNAHLETGTVNGPMQIDFPVTIQGRITKRFSVDLGKGGATVRAVTTNGPVVVRRL
jgi:hypothetical protein